ncbi:hypothetical protein BOTCAL_0186g00190 [Botryotinia calthae]|uniref:Heterokaryon incompatibility domain-containing protein n=1 Tax=Botryotinia calthae TaxID=38488 RepID=A0A4Y8D0W2_9HELO|nr:hypothetical protein BOTCAL_0186g00190 [Botryotinia calthae]
MLNKCLEDHKECRSTRVDVARFRVIDVTMKRICQAPPDCEYIALSYVWGDNSACKSTQVEFPQVVKDAFTVTEALGYRYLWVDRYCIDQNPKSPHMQSMISQMDLVYSNAWATIVAASGNSASDGLPGISVPRYQAHADIGETHLIEVSNVAEDIILSKWFTRGWTYQEWYFSRRRLIFADSEVMLLCNEGKANETVSGHDFYPLGFSEYEFESMKPPDPLETPEFSLYNLQSHISGFSKRNISHDCDSLNAFAGILRYYESISMGDNRPMTHLWGVPLMLLGHGKEEGVFFDLLWDHKAIAHRRNGLPSWSWSSWGGSATFGNSGLKIQTHTVELAAYKPLENSTDENEGVTSAAERILRIQIPLEDRTVDLDSFCRERQLNLHREICPKELHITSFIMPLRFCEVLKYNPTEIIAGLPPLRRMATFLVRPGIFLGTPVCFDREYNFELHKFGLVLPSAGQFYNLDIYSIIVLHPVADGKYERAGINTLSYDADTGELSSRELCGSWDVLLDENNNLIPDKNPEYENPLDRASNKYLFLQGAEWKTICLV